MFFNKLDSPVLLHHYCAYCFSYVDKKAATCPNTACMKGLSSQHAKGYFIEIPVVYQLSEFFSQNGSYSDTQWLRSHLSFFYHSKRKFTMVNGFFNVTRFSHFTMVNASLVCCVSNGGRMKAKFTIVKPSEKAWFIACLLTARP